LLDDHVLFRESLSRLLGSESGFEIAGECATAAQALEIMRQKAVDVVLLDYDLGKESSDEFMTAMRAEGYQGKVLMVTAGMNASETSAMLKAGASGVFLKHSSPGLLSMAIRLVAQGQMWVDQKVLQMLAEGVSERDEPMLQKLLTDREQQVLQGLFEGLTNKEIAGQLGVSESAVKATLQQLFQKTRVRTRSQLVRIALESSLGPTRKL